MPTKHKLPEESTSRVTDAAVAVGAVAADPGIELALRVIKRREHLAGEELSAQGLVPPFLSRLFAQSRGIQAQGTNTPFAFKLPPEVPLVSKLAYLQMTPDEQQALLSYVSSYGVTPDEYLNQIDRISPQGETAPFGPQLGSRFQFNRQ